MNNKEALTSAKQRLFNMQATREFYKCPPNMLTETIDFLKTAILSLEKQIPKKAITTKITEFCTDHACPVCGCDFEEYKYNFCFICGQRLDWSEIE